MGIIGSLQCCCTCSIEREFLTHHLPTTLLVLTLYIWRGTPNHLQHLVYYYLVFVRLVCCWKRRRLNRHLHRLEQCIIPPYTFTPPHTHARPTYLYCGGERNCQFFYRLLYLLFFWTFTPPCRTLHVATNFFLVLIEPTGTPLRTVLDILDCLITQYSALNRLDSDLRRFLNPI